MVDPKLIKYHNLADELDAYVAQAQEDQLDEKVVQALKNAAQAARQAKDELLKKK